MVSGPESRRVLAQLDGDEANWSKDRSRGSGEAQGLGFVVLVGLVCRGV